MRILSTRRAFLSLVLWLALGALVACGGQTNNTAQTTAAGDPVKGEIVFKNTGCVGCHATTDQKLVGPGLAGIFKPGGPKLPDGVDYGGKLPNGKPLDDKNVAEWIKTGGIGKIGQMPGHVTLTPEQFTDLIAYLKTL